MENIIECVLKNLFDDRKDLFGEESIFKDFKKEQDFLWKDGYQSAAIFGRIVYEKKNQLCLSDPLVLKITPQIIPEKDVHVFAFINEIYFYSIVVPFFESFRTLDLFAKYYNGHVQMKSKEYQAVIVFENLQAGGYMPAAKKSFLDYAHLSLALRKLGEWHAYSFKARKEDPNRFSIITNCMNDIHIAFIHEYINLIPGCAMRGLESLFNDPRYSDKLGNIQKIFENIGDFILEILDGDTKNPMSVLCHGDFLRNNILFKFRHNEPSDLKIIDLANCKMASPVVDLALLLYINSDQDTRKNHWHDLINEYYVALKETFPDVEVPTKEQILNEFRRKSFYVYFVASFFLGTLMADDYNLPGEKECLPEEFWYTSPKYIPKDIFIKGFVKIGGSLTTEALTNILKDMIDRGFI
ncbi:hypothetical protein PGB90_004786 [Kerria lacca]